MNNQNHAMMKTTNIITAIGLVLLLAVQTSCRENEFGTVDLTITDTTNTYVPVAATYTFNHPCAMYSQNDFDRVKASLDAGTAPDAVKKAYQALINSPYSQLTYTAQPQTQIIRGDATGIGEGKENYAYAMRDAAAAYQTALLWKLTGNAKYADLSVSILDAWAATCTEITSNDANQVLAAGAQGYTFANAAEIMQTYSGWSSSKITVFKNWIVKVFASKNKSFLDTHTGSNVCSLHYWSNWDLVNMCSYLSIGILTENNDMVNFVVNYFYNGVGNGCIKNLIQGTFDDPLGTGEKICQDQESGRDQGHAEMSAMVTANLAQMAYTLYTKNSSVSKLDFFSANDNALLKLGEYVALSNLKSGTDNTNSTGSWIIAATKMPFNTYYYCVNCTCKDKNHGVTHTQVADDTGRGGVRPGWEIYYNHYAKVKGLASGYAYVKQFADKLRPECGAGDSRYGSNSGAFDQLGWSTLMLYRE
jgi:hypothetical protein